MEKTINSNVNREMLSQIIGILKENKLIDKNMKLLPESESELLLNTINNYSKTNSDELISKLSPETIEKIKNFFMNLGENNV